MVRRHIGKSFICISYCWCQKFIVFNRVSTSGDTVCPRSDDDVAPVLSKQLGPAMAPQIYCIQP